MLDVNALPLVQELARRHFSGMLHERIARCKWCNAEFESAWSLNAFEYFGPGSDFAVGVCLQCSRRIERHDATFAHAFRPYGPALYDAFDCGCREVYR